MKLKTLADVRTLVEKLPKEFRVRSTSQCLQRQLAEAAADTINIATALQLVLMMALSAVS